MMGKARYVAAAACAALLAAGAGACGTSVSVVTKGAAQGPTIAIGVAADQPGLGYLHGGEYSGFDIDVAKYVAKTLGYAEKQIVFKQLSPAMRASALTDGTVDMVVDSFSMDGTHDGEADVAGPYLTVGRRSSAPTAHRNHQTTACPIKPYVRSLEAQRPTTSATARKTPARRWRNATRIRNA